MDRTLDGALSKAWGNGSQAGPSTASPATSAQLDALLGQLEAAKASGDWTTYGARLDELRSRLNGDSGTDMPQTN